LLIDGQETTDIAKAMVVTEKTVQNYISSLLSKTGTNSRFKLLTGKFGPDDPVTREQAVVILYRYAKSKGLDVSASADLSKFVDRDNISDWALDAMKWAVAVGIIQGRPGNKTAPADTSTRAEIAMIFKRYVHPLTKTN